MPVLPEEDVPSSLEHILEAITTLDKISSNETFHECQCHHFMFRKG